MKLMTLAIKFIFWPRFPKHIPLVNVLIIMTYTPVFSGLKDYWKWLKVNQQDVYVVVLALRYVLLLPSPNEPNLIITFSVFLLLEPVQFGQDLLKRNMICYWYMIFSCAKNKLPSVGLFNGGTYHSLQNQSSIFCG